MECPKSGKDRAKGRPGEGGYPMDGLLMGNKQPPNGRWSVVPAHEGTEEPDHRPQEEPTQAERRPRRAAGIPFGIARRPPYTLKLTN
eukprot:2759684-Amphidinium_carterae.1